MIVIKTVDKVPEGFLHIADDGLARSCDENDVVINFVRLTNELLMQLLLQLPAPDQKEMDCIPSLMESTRLTWWTKTSCVSSSWLRPARKHEISKRSDHLTNEEVFG